MRGLVAAVVIGAVLALGGAATSQTTRFPACTGFTAGTDAGRVGDPSVVELSGIAASRAHPGVLWVHNDSGGEPELSALSSTGGALGRYRIEGAESTDWEDIGIGPGPEPGRSYLYIGDIGDNDAGRDHVTVYVVAEPDAAPGGAGGALPIAKELTIRYPDGPSDAESIFVDPLDGSLYIITKNFDGSPSHLLRATADDVAAGGEVTMADVLELGQRGLIITSADISPDGSTVLVRTYRDVLAYRRPEGRPLAEAFAAKPCTAPSVNEQQGEAVAFTPDGAAYLTASEGVAVPLHRFGVDPPMAPTTTTTTTASTSTSTTVDVTGKPSDDGATVPWLVVGVAVVVVAAGLATWFGVVRGRSRQHPR